MGSRREASTHWDLAEYGYFCHHHYIGGPQPLSFPGAFGAPSRAIDYRVYLPRLLADFQERGGDFRAGQEVSPEEIVRLSGLHDLVVVATGKGGTSAMFPVIAGKSPYGRPQRRALSRHRAIRAEGRDDEHRAAAR